MTDTDILNVVSGPVLDRPHYEALLVDARAFQDPNYSFRGVGRHCISLLSNLPAGLRSAIKLVALCDPALNALPEDYGSVFDEVRFTIPADLGAFAFFTPSPLTHELGFAQRLLLHENLQVSVAVVHDFIPYDFPGYFHNDAQAEAYLKRVELLKKYDFFLPNSECTARRLTEICGIDTQHMVVTRVAVKDHFFTAGGSSLRPTELSDFLNFGDFVLTVCGQDLRKNVEVCIKAVAILNGQRSKFLRLVVVGHYSETRKAELKQMAQRLSGDRNWLVFAPFLSDKDLRQLYQECRAVIAPSFIEGFSMPVAEGIVAGSLVLASNCDAHQELVATPEALFDPTSASILADAIQLLALDENRRATLIHQQAAGLPDLRETVVADRAWHFVGKAPIRVRRRGRKHLHCRRPRLALFSPYLPQDTGVGVYSARMMRHLSKLADVDLYTDARVPFSDTQFFNKVHGYDEKFRVLDYDTSVFVIGNTKVYHKHIIERFEETGGAAIFHDSRMFEYYFSTLPRPDSLALATRILGRSVSEAEVLEWDDRKEKLPHSFLTGLLAAAMPAVVHSREQQRHIREQYGTKAEYLPFGIQFDFQAEELDSRAVALARQSLGFSPTMPVVCVFGSVDYSKGVVETTFALNELVKWGSPMQLMFVGNSPPPVQKQLRDFAEPLGVSELLHFTGPVTEAVYRRHLIAADLGLQLRLPLFGQVSGALSDCVAAGITTVANVALADAIEAPDYILRLPDRWSPVLIAEALLKAHEHSKLRPRNDEMRASYVAAHNFESYARGLLRKLGHDVAVSNFNL